MDQTCTTARGPLTENGLELRNNLEAVWNFSYIMYLSLATNVKLKKRSSYVESTKTHNDLVRGLIDRGTKQQITYTNDTDTTLHATKAKLLWSY